MKLMSPAKSKRGFIKPRAKWTSIPCSECGKPVKVFANYDKPPKLKCSSCLALGQMFPQANK